MGCKCMNWLQSRMIPEDPTGNRTTVLVLTEIVRWMAFVVPIYLSVWRWTDYQGFPIYFTEENKRGEFWGIVTIIFVSSSLLIYLPIKLYCVKFLGDARDRWGWRPSILQYILLCALPCIVIILLAVKLRPADVEPDMKMMDTYSMLAIQFTVMGLTVTEWMAKLREEHFTYDLVGAMATDFFFAYDVIDFFMMTYHDSQVFLTYWFYITFAFGFVAMFKYIPTQPTSICDEQSCGLLRVPKGAITCILVSMFCNDIPFVIVRLTTMIEYGFAVSDLIHPAKNIALIVFGIMQLYIIYKNHKCVREQANYLYPERRQSRYTNRDKFTNAIELVIDEARKDKESQLNNADGAIEHVNLNNRNNKVYPPLHHK